LSFKRKGTGNIDNVRNIGNIDFYIEIRRAWNNGNVGFGHFDLKIPGTQNIGNERNISNVVPNEPCDQSLYICVDFFSPTIF
jgi:hypothetical protein